MQLFGIILKTILIKVFAFPFNWICYSILNLATRTGETVRVWIIVINDPLKYKNTSGPF